MGKSSPISGIVSGIVSKNLVLPVLLDITIPLSSVYLVLLCRSQSNDTPIITTHTNSISDDLYTGGCDTGNQ